MQIDEVDMISSQKISNWSACDFEKKDYEELCLY
jgi:hypothetical protein